MDATYVCAGRRSNRPDGRRSRSLRAAPRRDTFRYRTFVALSYARLGFVLELRVFRRLSPRQLSRFLRPHQIGHGLLRKNFALAQQSVEPLGASLAEPPRSSLRRAVGLRPTDRCTGSPRACTRPWFSSCLQWAHYTSLSPDAGDTSNVIGGPYCLYLRTVAFAGPRIAYASDPGCSNLLRSEDAGQSWVPFDPFRRAGLPAERTRHRSFARLGPTTIYALAAGQDGPPVGEILWSRDSGQSWSLYRVPRGSLRPRLPSTPPALWS